jgi:hypothetical protein
MFRDLKWKRYKAVGAEVDTRHMYLRYELFLAVKQVDLQVRLSPADEGAWF